MALNTVFFKLWQLYCCQLFVTNSGSSVQYKMKTKKPAQF